MTETYVPVGALYKRTSGVKESTATSPLSSVVLSISDFCNIACSYCFEAKSRATLSESGRQDRILDLLFRSIQRSSEQLINVSFYGGEPLAHLDIVREITQKFRRALPERVIRFAVATNGTLLDEESLAFLLENDFDVQVSIDGEPDVHDIHRLNLGGKGSYRQLRFVLDRLDAIPRATARMTVTPMTAPYFARSIEHLLALGFAESGKKIKIDFDRTAEWTETFLAALFETLPAAADSIVDHISQSSIPFLEPLDRVYQAKYIYGTYCGAGRDTAHVTPGGEVYPCNRLTPSHNPDYRSLRLDQDGGMEEMRVNEVRREILAPLVRKPECGSCFARNYCDLTCPARVRSASGDFTALSDTHCGLTRVIARLGQLVRQRTPIQFRAAFARAYGVDSVFA